MNEETNPSRPAPPESAPESLIQELRRLHRPGFSVPGEVDRAVLATARSHLRGHGRRRLVFRLASATAAAAGIALAFLLWNGDDQKIPVSATIGLTAPREDVDHSGRVDILDAFTLARRLESASVVNQHWDINSDGQVNDRDVDVLATMAVRLDMRRG